jgi:hypothetical protein
MNSFQVFPYRELTSRELLRASFLPSIGYSCTAESRIRVSIMVELGEEALAGLKAWR